MQYMYRAGVITVGGGEDNVTKNWGTGWMGDG